MKQCNNKIFSTFEIHRFEPSRIVIQPYLFTAKWNQNRYYNQYSPLDPSSPSGYDGRCPSGCVAVAMAQIMYYYRFPLSGQGSHTNYTDYGHFTVKKINLITLLGENVFNKNSLFTIQEENPLGDTLSFVMGMMQKIFFILTLVKDVVNQKLIIQ